MSWLPWVINRNVTDCAVTIEAVAKDLGRIRAETDKLVKIDETIKAELVKAIELRGTVESMSEDLAEALKLARSLEHKNTELEARVKELENGPFTKNKTGYFRHRDILAKSNPGLELPD